MCVLRCAQPLQSCPALRDPTDGSHWEALTDVCLSGKGVSKDKGAVLIKGPPRWHRGKESACNAGEARDGGWIPGLGRRKWQPTPVFLRGEFHGQRSQIGCSPWGDRELDMTELWTLIIIKLRTVVSLRQNERCDQERTHGELSGGQQCCAP